MSNYIKSIASVLTIALLQSCGGGESKGSTDNITPVTDSAVNKEEGFVQMFDGKTMNRQQATPCHHALTASKATRQIGKAEQLILRNNNTQHRSAAIRKQPPVSQRSSNFHLRPNSTSRQSKPSFP